MGIKYTILWYIIIVCLTPKFKPLFITIYFTPRILYYLQTSFYSGNHHAVVCIYELFVYLFFTCCFPFYIPHMNKIIWFLTFSVLFCLTWYSQDPSGFENVSISYFLMASSIPLFILPHLLHPVIYWRTLWLFPWLGHWIMLQWAIGCIYLCK